MDAAATSPDELEVVPALMARGELAARQVTPDLVGVSETLLWALHNRASEAARHHGVLVDPDSMRIHAAIDYDFARKFGEPAGFLAARAAEIDRTLRRWLKHHPDGFVVSLGEGLETQVRRVDNGRVRWLSVDLPAAIRLRERFFVPTERFRHIAVSVLDSTWMDAVDPSSGVFIVAQGLLMYLEPERVRQLFCRIVDRFPGVEMVFDVIPHWFSHLTLLGLQQTLHYRLPPMPWGINCDEIEPTLRRWRPYLASVAFLDYCAPRGLPFLLARLVNHIPGVRHEIPSLVHVTVAPKVHTSAANSNGVGLRACAPATRIAECEPDFNDPATSRKIQMIAIDDGKAGAHTICDMLAVAVENAGRGGNLAVAAGQIVAKRAALGIAAALDPLRADHVEFGRMVPEKVDAFSAAGVIMLTRSGDASLQMTRFASDAMLTTARATIEMAGCSNPAAIAAAQGRFALAWFKRAAALFINMGMLALDAQDAALVPVRETVAANTERLRQEPA